jgi:hypothetical protein
MSKQKLDVWGKTQKSFDEADSKKKIDDKISALEKTRKPLEKLEPQTDAQKQLFVKVHKTLETAYKTRNGKKDAEKAANINAAYALVEHSLNFKTVKYDPIKDSSHSTSRSNSGGSSANSSANSSPAGSKEKFVFHDSAPSSQSSSPNYNAGGDILANRPALSAVEKYATPKAAVAPAVNTNIAPVQKPIKELSFKERLALGKSANKLGEQLDAERANNSTQVGQLDAQSQQLGSQLRKLEEQRNQAVREENAALMGILNEVNKR